VLPDAWEIIQDPRRGLPEALKPSLTALCEETVALSTRISRFPSGRHMASFLGLNPARVLERAAAAPGQNLQTR
jgi:hypothetical protein